MIYLVLSYVVRELWKWYLDRKMTEGGDKNLLIITSSEVAEQTVQNLQEHNYARYALAGVVLTDADWTGREILGVPVVATANDAPMWMRY